jgi:hypothetical protein
MRSYNDVSQKENFEFELLMEIINKLYVKEIYIYIYIYIYGRPEIPTELRLSKAKQC